MKYQDVSTGNFVQSGFECSRTGVSHSYKSPFDLIFFQIL